MPNRTGATPKTESRRQFYATVDRERNERDAHTMRKLDFYFAVNARLPKHLQIVGSRGFSITDSALAAGITAERFAAEIIGMAAAS